MSQRPDNNKKTGSSIHTVEGNVAGNRAFELEKKRQRDEEDFQARRAQISSTSMIVSMDRFAKSSNTEDSFLFKTKGLVTAADFVKAAAEADAGDALPTTTTGPSEDQLAQQHREAKKARKQKLKQQKQRMAALSFAGEEEQDLLLLDDKLSAVKASKDPTVDTSFLPDRARDLQAQAHREQLEKEWKLQQERIQNEKLQIVYSYWDGSGHRRSVVCLKGNTIGDFLELVRKDLCREFRELTTISADDLIYIKEDLILPNDLTFYDLIATKARGKSGPLFHFDVHEDLRMAPIDIRIEKDESHPGKVVERRWYERNKHIFPASRWEIYDPLKEYGGYTIGDSKKKSIK